ncbi:hypothetical protein GW17_00015651 [Ensete ventricosum]|nr:hypothetical protein GW17_00015651 [Ensete ventricosum]
MVRLRLHILLSLMFCLSVRLLYVDRPLLGGTIENRLSTVDFGRRRSISTVNFSHRRSISTVDDRLREKSIVNSRLREKKEIRRRGKEEKKKKRRRRTYFPRTVLARVSSLPAGHPRAVATLTRERFFSRARRRNVSPRREKDRGDQL